MQADNTISVVIPTYNRAKDLIAAIRSVLDQTAPVAEILVCDDGSTDDSKERVEQLREPRVKWIDCGRNGRPAIPRNKGIQLASSNWVAFLDSDDQWLPGKIEEQLALVSMQKSRAVCSNAYRIAKGINKVPFHDLKSEQLSFTDLLGTNHVICSSMMVERKLLLATMFPEGPAFKAIEDYCLWLKIACFGNIACVTKPLLNYSDDPAQSIRANDVSEEEQRRIILDELTGWLKSTDLKNKKKLLKQVRGSAKDRSAMNFQRMKTGVKNQIKRLLKR